MPDLLETWRAYRDERSIALQPTSLQSDYRQTEEWLKRCPVTELEQGRDVMRWVLSQKPELARLRVGMYVKAMYRWATQEDVARLERNPILSFPFPKRPQSDDEVIVIPRSEMPFLMAGLTRKNKRLARWDLVAECMHQTACRTGEVFAWRWGDIVDEQVRVHQNMTLTHGLKASTKTNRPRWVPLNEIVRGILEEMPRTSEFVFPWNRYSFQSFFNDRVKLLLKQDVISKAYRPYDLRHTAISGWLEAGIPIAKVSSWAGNSAEVIWKHYANSTQEYQMPTL